MSVDPLRRAIAARTRAAESDVVQGLLDEAHLPPERLQDARAVARTLVENLRARRSRSGGVDALMHEFSLSSSEGVALMCLAEALLRIPDSATADALIRDKISRGDWRAHLGRSQSLFVNAAAWGLMITGSLVATHSDEGLGSSLTQLIARGGEPLIRKGVDLAMRLLGQQFVTGQTIEEALAHAGDRRRLGYRYTFDMLGEAALTAADADAYFSAYTSAIAAIGATGGGQGAEAGPGISVKLSALHPRYCRAQRDRVLAELLPRLRELCLLARGQNMGLAIDAEESERLDLSLELTERLAEDVALAGWDGLGVVVQSYQKRAPPVVDWVIDLARRCRRRISVRLVKGAYWDSEIKRAQVEGQAGYPVFTRKVHSDMCYLACARRLLAAADAIYPQFATHNALTLATVREMARAAGVTHYEFQCLHGMGESLYDQVLGPDKLDVACRIYAPVGSHETLLAYLVRRLLENGSNSSFVNQILDPAIGIDELLRDPVQLAAKDGGAPHRRIPLPVELFAPERRNSAGLDLNDEATLLTLEAAFAQARRESWGAAPLLADSGSSRGETRATHNPARLAEVVGHVHDASRSDLEVALAAAQSYTTPWSQTAAGDRAQLLDRVAELLEAHRDELMWLAVHEAGKTLANALGEVREAVDFCRYYACQLRAPGFDANGHPLGVVTCISPWNFPLAIFIGQVTAALASGNVVVAKPAEQTPLIAAHAVRLMHEAGVPRAALQLVPGDGGIGALLVADARVRGVLFTGSTEVAALIDRQLASRSVDEEIVLVAETGGINAMVVDSSALPEQVVADVLASGFDSAGQRCSALRVLCLQEEIADRLLAMLHGAMRELVVGDPAQLATDIGPVIDADARALLESHVESPAGHPPRRAPAAACLGGTRHLCRADGDRDRLVAGTRSRSVRSGAPRAALSPGRTRRADRGDQRDRLRADLRRAQPHRRDDRLRHGARPRRQSLRQPQHDRCRGRGAALRWPRPFRHWPEGRRTADAAAAAPLRTHPGPGRQRRHRSPAGVARPAGVGRRHRPHRAGQPLRGTGANHAAGQRTRSPRTDRRVESPALRGPWARAVCCRQRAGPAASDCGRAGDRQPRRVVRPRCRRHARAIAARGQAAGDGCGRRRNRRCRCGAEHLCAGGGTAPPAGGARRTAGARGHAAGRRRRLPPRGARRRADTHRQHRGGRRQREPDDAGGRLVPVGGRTALAALPKCDSPCARRRPGAAGLLASRPA